VTLLQQAGTGNKRILALYRSLRSVPVAERMASIPPVLLVAISIAMTHGLVHAQPPSAPQETVRPSSTTTNNKSGNNPSTSIQPGPLEPESSSPCLLRVPDTFLPSSAKATESATIGSFSYTPLSARCKLNLFLKRTYSPYTFASAGFQATEAQATGQWPHYGGGTQGWAKRLGATMANTESRRFIQTFALATILHQDPRYFPSPKKRFFSRAWYSATRVVITKNDNGDSTFNTSEFMGTLLTGALQNSYYPRHDRTFGDTMNRFSGALSSDVIGDLLLEFTPDMKRFFRKHAPNKILKIEEKLPIPADDKP
jgi:hypothetical protein